MRCIILIANEIYIEDIVEKLCDIIFKKTCRYVVGMWFVKKDMDEQRT